MLSFVVSLILCAVLTCAETTDLPHSYHFEPSNNTFVKDYIQLPPDARSLSPTFQTDRPPGKYEPTSQAGQDTMIISLFGQKSNGFFVDLASNHYTLLSNSFSLEQWNNWKGVCIEPNPMYLQGLLANRKCKVFTCAVGEIILFVSIPLKLLLVTCHLAQQTYAHRQNRWRTSEVSILPGR
jgi:hypothetical protein